MAIQFDKLPTQNQYHVEADVYLARIEEAEMRKPKPTADGKQKPPYLSLKYRLTRHNGKSAGVMFDGQYDSDKQIVQYKLARFLTACGIPLKGAMELSDIANLVLNKEIVVDTKVDESGSQPRLQVDPFGREAYYPKEQFDEIWSLAHPDADEFVKAPEDDGEEPPFMQVPEGTDTEEEF